MRLPSRTARAALLILLVVAASAAAALPGSSAAPAAPVAEARAAAAANPAGLVGAEVPRLVRAAPAPLAVLFSSGESISILDGNCVNAKSSFSLGDTVCVTATGPGDRRRVLLINPDNLIVDSVLLTAASQTFTFTLPSVDTGTLFDFPVDNRGTWRISLIDTTDASVREFALIAVSDPARQVADLQVNSTVVGSTLAVAGANINIQVRVYNAGPDAAQNVAFSDASPANTTFLSISQTSGPTFNCTTPGLNVAGTTTCTRASLANGEWADFLVSYKVNTSVANGTELTSTSSVSSATLDNRSKSDSAESGASASNPTPPACTMSCPANITVTAPAGQSGAVVTFDGPTLGGTCGEVTSTPASGSFFAIGTSVVTSSTPDGQSCSFIVTVNPAEDTEGPTISCPGDIVVDESSSAANSATVSYSVGATDDSGSAVVTCNPPSGSSFPVGTTEVNCVATDASGNSNSCSFNVTVNETGCNLDANSAAPVPNVASLPTITRSCSLTLLAADDPNATDACGGTVNGDTTSDRVYEVPGTYTVVWTYTDSAGHVTTQNQTVVILPDNSAPVPDAASLPTVTGECSAAITGPAPTATDNCGGGGMEGTALDPLSYNTPGTHTVRWKFTDAAGNSTIQNQTVVVTDTQNPVITLNGPASDTVECHTSYNDPLASATDNCGAAPTITTSGGVDTGKPGTYVVTYTATDAAGNAASVQRTVTVVDTTKPAITLNGASPMTVECHTSFSDPGATASDSCDTGVPVVASGAVNVNVPGTYTINYTATDDSGNTASASRTVNVVDTTKPVITVLGANPYTVILGSSFTDPGATAADGCAGPVPVAAAGVVNTNAVGSYTITYTAVDPSGNSAVPATRTVNVIYNFAGFFSPVGNAPTLNQANAGRSIPVKFSLSGNQGLNIMAAGSPYSQQVSCGLNDPTDLQETGTAGSSSLSYDASTDRYVYVWKTESSWAGTCRVLTVALIDGTTHTAYFKFK